MNQSADSESSAPLPPPPPMPEEVTGDTTVVPQAPPIAGSNIMSSGITVQEREVIRLIVNYGMCYLGNTQYEDGTERPSTVLEHISNELELDQMTFSNPLYRRTFEIAKSQIASYYEDLARFNASLGERVAKFMEEETNLQNQQEPEGLDSAALINAQERIKKSAEAKASVMAKNELQQFSSSYLMKVLCSLDDDDVRQLACDLAADNLPQLSKIHTQFAVILEEQDKLLTLVPDRLYNWKNAILLQKINDLKSHIAHAQPDELPQLMEQLQQLYSVRHQLAAIIGDRVVNPK